MAVGAGRAGRLEIMPASRERGTFKKARRYGWLWVFMGTLALQILGTWTFPLIDRDEPKFAEASREMLRSGQYVVPKFNGEDRLDKPPLIYWLQAASMRVLGENEFAARVPSILACAGVAALLCLAGARLATEEAGIRSAIIFATGLLVLMFGRLGLADMVMVFFVTLGFWAGWELAHAEDSDGARSWHARWWWLYYGSLWLGFLAKGPIAWLPLLAPIWTAMRERGGWRRFGLVWGLAFSLGMIALWGVPALILTHGEYFRIGLGRHVAGRFIFSIEGNGSRSFMHYLAFLPFYFVTVFASFAPWSFFLPRLAALVRLEGRLSALESYLATGVAVTFGIFTIMNTKLPHYTLPCFPLLALWVGLRWPELSPSRRNFSRIAVSIAVLAVVVAGAGGWWAGKNLVAAKLETALAAVAKPGAPAMTLDCQEPSVIWALRGRTDDLTAAAQPANLSHFMGETGSRLCVLPSAEKKTVFPTIPNGWRQVYVDGINPDHGSPANLVILSKDD